MNRKSQTEKPLNSKFKLNKYMIKIQFYEALENKQVI